MTLEEAQALHDAASTLTPAGVAHDEHAHATWLPRLAQLHAHAADPALPWETRAELEATLEALTSVGIAPP